MLNTDAANAIQPELAADEHLLWTGVPAPSVTFHKEDLYLVPFSLMWGGFALFWESSVLGIWGHTGKHAPPFFMVLWGVPFVLVGQYFIWGRFVLAAWKKRRTYYAVTNRRAIVVQDGWTRKTASAFLDGLPTLIKEGGRNGLGTLRFAAPVSPWSNRSWQAWDSMSVGDAPVFCDIEDVDGVYRLVSKERERLRGEHGVRHLG